MTSTILFFALLFLAGVKSIPCGVASVNCLSVSDHPLYVYCNPTNQQCACYADRGFLGNATPGNRCRCPSELKIHPDGGKLYCTTLQNGVAYQLETALNNEIIRRAMMVYTELKHPRPPIINSNLINGIPDPYLDLFSNDTKGRVAPVGLFEGHAMVVEYYAGAMVTGATQVHDAYFNSVGVYNYTSFIDVVLNISVMNTNQTAVVRRYPLNQIGTDRFNRTTLKIYSGSKDIVMLDAAVKWVGTLNFSSPILHQQICTVLLTVSQCTPARDPLGHYDNVSDCLSYLGQLKPGSLVDTLFDADTVACRYFHMVFTRADPFLHCPHAGKTGGGKCIVTEYISWFYEKYKKRYGSGEKRGILEINTENMNAVLNEILLKDRLNLILAGIPTDSPLVTIPLAKVFDDLREPLEEDSHEKHGASVGHHKPGPIEKTRIYIETMKADNWALFDSIYLPQAASLIAAGVPESDPAIAGPRERLVKRKRGTDYIIMDPQLYIDGALASRDASYTPTYVPSVY